jgi:hypothetical protein
MRIKKSQRRSRKAGRKAYRSRRAGRKACRSRSQARRIMHGGAVVTVYNQIPHSDEIGNVIKIQYESFPPPVLQLLIEYLKQNVSDADAFAKGRGTTRDQLITELNSGVLDIHPIDYESTKYGIIRVGKRPPFPSPPQIQYHESEPFRIPEYVPPPSSRSDL